jgi:3-hydroxyisobutyrate dehydrogenase
MPTRMIGFIGIGAMGFPMARRLVAAGHGVMVTDADPERCDTFVGEVGGCRADSLAGLGAASEIVICMLPNGDIVRRVVTGTSDEPGVASALAEGSVLIDMSSSAPWDTRRLGAELEKRGVRVLDAPVSGGVGKARTGELAIMAGGDAGTLDSVRPVLEAIGKKILHAGPLGAGQAVKALNNMLSAVGLFAASEVLIAASKFGLDPATVLEILNQSTGRNNSTENKLGQFVLNHAFNSGFALDLMVKDLTIAREIGERGKSPLLLGGLCRELCAAAMTQLDKGADHTEVARWLEMQCGFSFGEKA